MQSNGTDAFMENVRSLLREIREIRQDTGYAPDQVLMAMLVESVRELKN